MNGHLLCNVHRSNKDGRESLSFRRISPGRSVILLLGFTMTLWSWCHGAPAQESEEVKSTLSSILALTPADMPKALAMVRQCSAAGAETLSRGLLQSGRKAIDAGDWGKARFLYECAAEAARSARSDKLLANAEFCLGSIHLQLHD